MAKLNFVTAKTPKRQLIVDLDSSSLIDQELLLEGTGLTDLTLILGTSPSWEEISIKRGYSEKREKYITQIRSGRNILSTIWIVRQHLFLTGDPFYMEKAVEWDNHYWNDENYSALPVVTDQFTTKEYHGFGLNGTLIALANTHYSKLFGKIPLYSSTSFARMTDRRGKEIKEVRGSRRVWEKLEDKALAEKRNWFGKTRWSCK